MLLLLSTEVSQRRSNDIRRIESAYNWPVVHREGRSDLSGGEANFYTQVQEFNARSRNIKIIFINQFGFTRKHCGERMPEEMTFANLRYGADLEFGLSVYEPFGISQLEPLSFGALCLVSNVCGCMGFARRAAGEALDSEHILEASFLGLPEAMGLEQFLTLSITQRDAIEAEEAERLARLVAERLTTDADAIERRIAGGYELASRMNWQHVVEDYFLPSLARTAEDT